MKNKVIRYNPALKSNARKLRKTGTYGEVYLWNRLKRSQLGYKFTKQKPLGDYIVDFYCSQLRLVIEIDGHSHLDRGTYQKDLEKQAYLESMGLRVLRIIEAEILHDADEVANAILLWIKDNILE